MFFCSFLGRWVRIRADFGWVFDSVGFGPIQSDSWPSTSVTLLKVDPGYIWIRFRVRFTRIPVDSTTLNPNHHPRHSAGPYLGGVVLGVHERHDVLVVAAQVDIESKR